MVTSIQEVLDVSDREHTFARSALLTEEDRRRHAAKNQTTKKKSKNGKK
jgi:hypothetical protein